MSNQLNVRTNTEKTHNIHSDKGGNTSYKMEEIQESKLEIKIPLTLEQKSRKL